MIPLPTLLSIAIIIILTACSRKAEQVDPEMGKKPTPAIAAFLDAYQQGYHDIAVERMQRIQQATDAPAQPAVGTETYAIPMPKGVMDYFQYTIIHRPSENTFRVIREGGVAGVYEIYEVTGSSSKNSGR